MKDHIGGTSGWREFLQNRQEILNKVETSKQKNWNRPVQVAHGNVAEAAIRAWLTHFLPKKYGVTSGYIIPNLYNNADKLLHYDIIIYEQLEAPILWVEGNDDESKQGRKLAIPAKYVRAVYEVKSTLTKKNATDAYNKLKEINQIKEHMNSKYSSGAIFVDLPKTALKNKTILPALLAGRSAHGCWGGVIMQAPGDELAAGLIVFSKAEVGVEKFVDPLKLLFEPIDSVDIRINEEKGAIMGGDARITSDGVNTWYITKFYRVFHSSMGNMVEINWSRSGFSDFAIQLLSTLEGLAEGDPNRPAFGMVYDLPKREDAPLQPTQKKPGGPHVEISLRKYPETNSYIRVEQNDYEIFLCIKFEVLNTGDVDVDITVDAFENFETLGLGEMRAKEIAVAYQIPKEKKIEREALLKTLQEEIKPCSIKQRFVYRFKNESGEKAFFAVIAAFDVFSSGYSLSEKW